MRNSATNSAMLIMIGLAATCGAAPRIVTLPGAAAGSNNGAIIYGGSTRSTLSSSSMTTTEMGGSFAFATACSDDGLFAAGPEGFSGVSRWSSATGTWAPVPPDTANTGINSVDNVRDISATGRYLVGQCSTDGPGWFAGWVWDANSNVTRKLLGNTPSARACGVSADGSVIVGGESPNEAGIDSGGRAGVWRFNPSTGSYDWSYLPDGPTDALGGIVYRIVDDFHISDNGNMIVGTSFKYNPATDSVDGWLTRWTWNGSAWMRSDLYNISQGPTTISSWWTPFPDCPIPPDFTPTAMTDDGHTIVGILRYSTCGSFVSAGFVYTGGTMHDLYDWIESQGLDLDAPGYGVFNSGGVGLCHLGYALDISDDGMNLYGEPVFDPDAPGPWAINLNVAGGCIVPAFARQPRATTNFSACDEAVFLGVGIAGSAPFSYVWTKNGVPITDGPTGNGSSTYQIVAGGRQLRVNGPLSPADHGTYVCTVMNGCGSTSSIDAIVQLDPVLAAAPSNDNCATAQVVAMGHELLVPPQSPCGSFTIDPFDAASCAAIGSKVDLWYSFTPTATGTYRIETCGANYDTIVSVFAGCGGGEVACNDDLTTGQTTSCGSSQSRVAAVMLQGGQNYRIRIAAPALAYLYSEAVTNLSIFPAPPVPPEDSCITPATALEGANPFNTTEASPTDNMEPLSCSFGGAQSRDVWFTYTPATSGLITLSTCPQGTAPNGYELLSDTVISIHSSPCGAVLACNDQADPQPPECVWSLSAIRRFPVTAGTPIAIRVSGGNSFAHGAGTLTLARVCTADVDDGSGTGLPDGGVTIDDLLYYLALFEAGDVRADVDDGSFTGTPDGGVTIDDLLYYLARFEAGC